MLLSILRNPHVPGSDKFMDIRAMDSSLILDPTTLSVQELKKLVKGRGLQYTIPIEKEDFVELLKSTGELLHTRNTLLL